MDKERTNSSCHLRVYEHFPEFVGFSLHFLNVQKHNSLADGRCCADKKMPQTKEGGRFEATISK